MTELRECPFCGGKAKMSVGRDGENERWTTVGCEQCGAWGREFMADQPRAADAWNRRADDWQTIETAPRDGTEVLTWDGLSHQVLHWFDGGHESLWINEEGTPCEDATHWRPLPEGPR